MLTVLTQPISKKYNDHPELLTETSNIDFKQTKTNANKNLIHIYKNCSSPYYGLY